MYVYARIIINQRYIYFRHLVIEDQIFVSLDAPNRYAKRESHQ